MANILLIEDMDGVRATIAMILTRAGHNVVTSADGGEGLRRATNEKYDLIISDILMPHVDGGEVIATLKSDQPDTPVLAISGGGSGVSVEEALRVAKEMADAVLRKPFSRDELLNAVTKHARTNS